MADEKLPPSVEWVGNRVTSLLRTKPELFAKLYLTEADADVQPIRRFMSDDSCTKIFFLASAKELLVMEVPPPSNKKKVRLIKRATIHKAQKNTKPTERLRRGTS